MAILHNQKVATKIISILGIVLCFNLIVGIVGYHYSKEIAAITDSMYNSQLVPVQLMQEVRFNSKDTEMKLLALILANDSSKQQVLIKAIEKNTKTINTLQEKYQATHLDSFEKAKWDELQQEVPIYRQARADIIKLAVAGQGKEALELFEKNQPIFARLQNIRGELADYNVKSGYNLHIHGDELVERALKIIVGITLFTIVLSIMLGLLLSKAISFPLSRMVAAVEQIANGDVSKRPRTFVSRDEMGQLADMIIKMRSDLCQLIIRITQSSQQVAAASEELTATAEQSAEATNQVASSIAGVADGSANQVRATEHAIGIMNNMSQSIEQVVSSVTDVASVAGHTTTAAGLGVERVGKAVDQINKIESTVISSAQVVKKLGERSKDIGQIVETIAGIAGQTNLLALNAAIEAARAGEQGRGFAVVAEEVRKLAEQSEIATKQIASLIAEIREETERAVVAMEKGTQEVKVGTEVVNSAGNSFKEIVGFIDQMVLQIQEVDRAAGQMKEDNKKIVTTMADINKVTQDNASQAENVSAATEEQSASIQEIASSSHALAKLAEELEGWMRKFKVS